MVQNINQFAQTFVQGQLDLEFAGSVVGAAIGSGVVTPVIAGQALKLEASAVNSDGAPKLVPLTSNTDNIYGFAVRNLKDQSFPANARIELALANSVMVMTANTSSPTIPRGSPVEFDYVTNTVLAWAGVNPVCGFAYDSAVAAGDLLRVYISPPAFRAPAVPATPQNITVVATLAQINAGLTLIPGLTGKKITVTGYSGQVAGTFTTGTSVELESTNGTPVAVATIAEAGLGTGAVLTPNESHTTLGAGFGVPLGTSDGLKIINNGSAQAGGTSITFNITYTQF